MMKFHDLGDQAGLEEAVKIVNKIGFRTFGASFEKMEVPELLVAARSAWRSGPPGGPTASSKASRRFWKNSVWSRASLEREEVGEGWMDLVCA